MNKLFGFIAVSLIAALGFVAPAQAQSQHEQIVEHFGGEYDPEGAGAYVRRIVERLEPHADLDRPIRHVSVLDTPMINAFATPEGGVYVTRGLMSLANSEDELAGVIGHEIAHVAEGHGRQRQGASILAGLAGIALQAAGAGDLAMLGYNVGANLGMASYSRTQERDSDNLAIRYLVHGGYDPFALHDFFRSMRMNERLNQQLSGRGSFNPAMEFFSTHPNTEGRIENTLERAGRRGRQPTDVARTVEPYFDLLDGMNYGDAEEQGFVLGQRFVHPDLRFEYEVPEGYRIRNGSRAVTAQHRDGSQIYFDLGTTNRSKNDLDRYLRNDVTQEFETQISNVQRFTVNGVRAASGDGYVTQGRDTRRLFVVVFEGDGNQIFRMFMTGPRDRRSFDERGWLDTAGSFRRLSSGEAEDVATLRIDIIEVRQGDTIASLADRMAFDDLREERFRTLNGIGTRGDIEAGELVKIVIED